MYFVPYLVQVKEVEENLEGFCLSTYTNISQTEIGWHFKILLWFIRQTWKEFTDFQEFIAFLKISSSNEETHNYTHNNNT